MNTIRLIFIFLFSIHQLNAQKIILVTDQEHHPIAFPAIESKISDKKIIGDENGLIKIMDKNFLDNKVIVSCIGYTEQTINNNNFKDTLKIILKEEYTSLSNTTVTVKKIKWKTKQLGNKPKFQGICFIGTNFERGLLFRKTELGYIDNVYVFISDVGAATNKFRVHVYTYDSINQSVGNEITDSNVIVQGIGGQWVEVNLFNKKIATTQDFFVTVERFEGMSNDNSYQNYNSLIDNRSYYKTTKNGLKKAKIGKRKSGKIERTVTQGHRYKGQVLGLSRNNGKEITCSRRTDMVFSQKENKWPIETNEYFIPMIYLSYKYHTD